MNSTPSKLLPIDKHSHLQLQPQSSSASIFNSPTKPLNFPRTNSKPSLDPNSSSDTYTSEQDQEKGKEEKKDTAFQTSFDRNFDLDNSIDIQQTIQHQQQQPQQQQLSQTDNNLIDEFSFQTPMTSTLDLTKQNPTVDKVNENHAPTYINTSPNKSIMKKATPKASPKKVAFTVTNPEIHHYPDNRVEEEDQSQQKEDSVEPPSIQHQWKDPSQFNYSDEDTNASVPPTPPLHTTKPTFAQLLNKNNEVNLEPEALTDMKLKHENFSNLSLDEKVNLYLSPTNNNNSKNVSDMDLHLQNLQDASKNKTNENIHNLSFALKAPKNDIENPLNSLTNADILLRSSGSSQSSLQSLRNDNRVLESVPGSPKKVNPGLSLNDGIKGFSDEVVESLLPRDLSRDKLETTKENDAPEHNNENFIDAKSTNTNKGQLLVSSDDHLDSFDRSYNHTEQSILNLLNSASQSQISLNALEKQRQTQEQEQTQAAEPEEETSFSDNIKVKQEPKSNLEFVKVTIKKEPVLATEIKAPKREFSSRILRIKNEDEIAEPADIHPKKENEANSHVEDTDALLKKALNDDEESDTTQNSTKMSIRFHIDSDWKLEDSNDGDREDNDDISRFEKSDILNDVSQTSDTIGDKYGNSSSEITTKTLAPPRSDNNDKENSKSFEDPANNESSQQQLEVPHTKEDDSILANSSNIAPPEELTLPVVEANDYSSFNDVTKTFDAYSSFEESLSREHETDSKPINFISIWHKQEKQKKHQIHKVPTKQIIASYQQYKNEQESRVTSDKVKIPNAIQSKKFKEVNVMSRRVVSPDMDDLNVSQFLPELSEDSGFKDLNFANYSNNTNRPRSFTPLSTKNVLSNIDNDPNVVEPPEPKSYAEIRNARRLSANKAAPNQAPSLPQQRQPSSTRSNSNKRVSRFRVPTFEIRRTSSALAPCDMYNDIFDDFGAGSKPTIKAEGMKTLPSMDKDDVKRILNAKKGVTQDEYINAKLVDQKPKKNSIVTDPEDRYEELQQTASIHNATIDSSIYGRPDSISTDMLPYLSNELKKPPTALLSADRLFMEQEVRHPLRSNSVLVHPGAGAATNSSMLPEPDFELINSPARNVLNNSDNVAISGNASTISFNQLDMNFDDQATIGQNIQEQPASKSANTVRGDDDGLASAPETPRTPTKKESISSKPAKLSSASPRKSPIKIGSPVRVIKKNGSIAGIEPIPKATHKPKKSFQGNEISNHKVRDGGISPSSGSEHQQHNPSMVSVPSQYTDATSTIPDENKDVQHKPREKQKHHHRYHHHHHHKQKTDIPGVVDDEIPDVGLQERGKLFFRVLGIKNINLPDINTHKGRFTLTLDNGVHCVTTPEYNMDDHNVAIGKEFELTVADSLEFILTLKASYEKPRGTLVEVTEKKVVKSRNRLSRLFGSKDIITTTKFVPTEVKDTWANKFAPDGSFARCYIDLQQFEDQITGKALQFDLNCFNEWETMSNGNQPMKRGKPYKIAQLEVKMLYVPRSDPREILPTSIRSAYESINELNNEQNNYFEGYLHQEGGDCPIFKKRFFKLMGTSLLAHSEISHKTRAKINLSKVVDLIYVDKENIDRSNHRNFSDVLLLDHAFKIKFANGELIDFCAPNKHEMKIWIQNLQEIIYRNRFRRQPWVNLMLQQQQQQQQQSSQQ